jgi:hypothetical protein
LGRAVAGGELRTVFDALYEDKESAIVLSLVRVVAARTDRFAEIALAVPFLDRQPAAAGAGAAKQCASAWE